MIQNITYLKKEKNVDFWINFEKQLKSYIILCFFAFTIFRRIYQVYFIGSKGVLFGIFFTTAIKTYSLQGFLLGITEYFPHGLFYGLGILLLLFNLKNRYYIKRHLFKGILIIILCIMCLWIGAWIEVDMSVWWYGKFYSN